MKHLAHVEIGRDMKSGPRCLWPTALAVYGNGDTIAFSLEMIPFLTLTFIITNTFGGMIRSGRFTTHIMRKRIYTDRKRLRTKI